MFGGGDVGFGNGFASEEFFGQAVLLGVFGVDELGELVEECLGHEGSLEWKVGGRA